MSQKVTEQEVDYAYKVLDVLKDGFDLVAAKPSEELRIYVELVNKSPDILEAVLTLIPEEHRMKIYEVIKSATRMLGEIVKARI